MADEQTAQAVTAPDPTDFPAWEAAEKAGTNPSEPQNSPAETAEQPKESTSVPADGEQPAAKAEVAPEPEAGKKMELEQWKHLHGFANEAASQAAAQEHEARMAAQEQAATPQEEPAQVE